MTHDAEHADGVTTAAGSPTASDAGAPGPAVALDGYGSGHPYGHHHRRSSGAGAPVAAVAVYELVAVTVNRFVDADVLPTVSGLLSRPWRPAVTRRAVHAAERTTKWGVLVGGAAALSALHAARRSRPRR